ncbi:hypothetical protein ACFYPC_11280 [Streptomyces sp. NPDC005808]|uniref:hypothetical protein n=1 Tax=Streptomyces sp. NPDC005808 TaxID=3364734 RepID=UPI0036BF905A
MSTNTLTKGQSWVLGGASIAMVVVGAFGAWGTYSNAVAEFHRQATAAGVVAAGEGLTLILAMIMLGRTMLNQASPGIVRAGMWVAPVSASCIGVSIANDVREAAVYAVTPLAMSGAAEGLGLIARSIVVYRTGQDAEVMRYNADTARQLAFNRAVADGHPDKRKRKGAVRRYWRLAKHVGVGDTELGAGLVDVQRVRVRDGADAALASMYGGAAVERSQKDPAKPRPATATEVLRERFATMDPADAIRLAHDARPDARPAELASLLGTYGVPIDAVAVALVLGQKAPEYEVHRPDAADALQVNALEPLNVEGVVIEAASLLGPDASARAIAEHIAARRRLIVGEPYIRTALSRAARKPQPETPAKPMEGGFL